MNVWEDEFNTPQSFQKHQATKKIAQEVKSGRSYSYLQEGNKKLTNNYRGISLFNIDSKCLEKCIYEPLYTHFVQFMSDHQHSFVRKRSKSNQTIFLQRVHQSFYSDFSKAFDRVPHRLLFEKCASIGVSGCFLEIFLITCLKRISLFEWIIVPFQLSKLQVVSHKALYSGSKILHLHQQSTCFVENLWTIHLCRQPKAPFHWKSRMANSRRP